MWCRTELRPSQRMYHKGGSGKQRGFGFGGFQVSSSKKESTKLSQSPLAPPSAANKRGYMGLHDITQNAIYPVYGMQNKKPKTEEE
ncbi:DDX42 [Cordylochernes scorpioides]|uniref:DDX42 n=1 Tax=Cordylochernes scorpioides TaxID=51811 RepID=A0ABY6L8Q3_9ARAC|nr:DDX42 [Cordylochernes scorpioides]